MHKSPRRDADKFDVPLRLESILATCVNRCQWQKIPKIQSFMFWNVQVHSDIVGPGWCLILQKRQKDDVVQSSLAADNASNIKMVAGISRL